MLICLTRGLQVSKYCKSTPALAFGWSRNLAFFRGEADFFRISEDAPERENAECVSGVGSLKDVSGLSTPGGRRRGFVEASARAKRRFGLQDETDRSFMPWKDVTRLPCVCRATSCTQWLTLTNVSWGWSVQSMCGCCHRKVIKFSGVPSRSLALKGPSYVVDAYYLAGVDIVNAIFKYRGIDWSALRKLSLTVAFALTIITPDTVVVKTSLLVSAYDIWSKARSSFESRWLIQSNLVESFG